MRSYNTDAEFLDALRAEINGRYRPPAGALFTIAMIAVEGHGMMFISGKVVFSDEARTSRSSLTYPAMVLAEEWFGGVNAAIERLTAILSGTGRVGDHHVRGRFWGTSREDNFHSFSHITPWAESIYTTGWHHEGPRPAVNNDPVVAFGLPPYQTTRAAVAEWVHDRVLAPGLDAPHLNQC